MVSGELEHRVERLVAGEVVHRVPEEEAVRERAERYGCNVVLTRKELPKKLPNLVQAALEKKVVNRL